MTTLYEKRGRRYFPVAQHVAFDAFPEGSHLITVKPGSKAVSYRIDPDHAALIVAAQDAFEPMCEAIRKAFEREPSNPLTIEQRAILDKFVAAGGFPWFTRKSAAEIANAGLAVLIKVAGQTQKNAEIVA